MADALEETLEEKNKREEAYWAKQKVRHLNMALFRSFLLLCIRAVHD